MKLLLLFVVILFTSSSSATSFIISPPLERVYLNSETIKDYKIEVTRSISDDHAYFRVHIPSRIDGKNTFYPSLKYIQGRVILLDSLAKKVWRQMI